MMPEEKLRKADVVTAAGLVLLGSGVLIGAFRMPMSGTYGGEEVRWYTSPAAFPILVGFLIIAFAVGILARAVRKGAMAGIARYYADGIKGLVHNRAALRVLIIWVLLAGYVSALRLHPFGWVSRVLVRIPFMRWSLTRFCLEPSGANYVLASFVFLTAFIWLFYRPKGRLPDRRYGAFIVGLSAVVSFLVGYLFREQLFVPLP